MNLADAIRILRTYLRSILVITLVAAAAGVAYSFIQSPTYTSRATVWLMPRAAGSAGSLRAAQELAEAQARQFADLGNSPVVMEPVHKKLNLPGEGTSLVGRVRFSVPAGTTSIRIEYSHTNPQEAQRVVAASADQLLVTYKEFSPANIDQTLEARITSPASLPGTANGANYLQNVAIAMAIGLGLGVAQAFGRDFLNDGVSSERDIERITEHRVLGEVPFVKDGTKSGRGGFSVQEEAYRRLRTNLQFMMVTDDAKSFLVTSSVAGEGKTRTASSIAKAMADAGARVLLIDGDMRRPQVANYHNVDNAVGLSSALLHRTPIATLIQRVDNVDLLTSGPIPPNPSELLSSDAMRRLLEEATRHYDVVIVDTPPVLPVTDSTALSQYVDGVVVVADVTSARRRSLRKALQNLDDVHARVYGVVLNKLALAGGVYGYEYGYAYGYGYSYYGESKGGSRGRRAKKSSKTNAVEGKPRRGA